MCGACRLLILERRWQNFILLKIGSLHQIMVLVVVVGEDDDGLIWAMIVGWLLLAFSFCRLSCVRCRSQFFYDFSKKDFVEWFQWWFRDSTIVMLLSNGGNQASTHEGGKQALPHQTSVSF